PYNRASSQFQQMELQRGQAQEAVSRADASIRRTAALMNEHKGMISRQSADLLQSAISRLPHSVDGSSAQALQAATLAAQQAEQQAEEAYKSARRDVDNYESQQRASQGSDILGN